MVEFRFERSFHELALFQLEGRLFVNLRYQGGGVDRVGFDRGEA